MSSRALSSWATRPVFYAGVNSAEASLIQTSRPSRPLTATSRPAVPLVDLRGQYAKIRTEILQALDDVAGSTAYTLGPRVAAFEQAFAAFTGAKHCIGVNSGTSAL